MLLEKDFFKYLSPWYLTQNLDSLKNKSVLSMLNCLGPRIRNSLLMQASLLQQKSQSEHLRWKKKTKLENVSFSLCIKNWIVPKFKKCLFSGHINMIKPLFLHAYKVFCWTKNSRWNTVPVEKDSFEKSLNGVCATNSWKGEMSYKRSCHWVITFWKSHFSMTLQLRFYFEGLIEAWNVL